MRYTVHVEGQFAELFHTSDRLMAEVYVEVLMDSGIRAYVAPEEVVVNV